MDLNAYPDEDFKMLAIRSPWRLGESREFYKNKFAPGEHTILGAFGFKTEMNKKGFFYYCKILPIGGSLSYLCSRHQMDIVFHSDRNRLGWGKENLLAWGSDRFFTYLHPFSHQGFISSWAGNVKAIKDFLDRTEGKVSDKLEHSFSFEDILTELAG